MAFMLEFEIFMEMDSRLFKEQGGEAVIDTARGSDLGTSLLMESTGVVLDLRYLEYDFWRFFQLMKGYTGLYFCTICWM